MKINTNSWTAKKLYPVFQMSSLEGALKEAINKYFCMRAIKNVGLETEDFYLSDDLSIL